MMIYIDEMSSGQITIFHQLSYLLEERGVKYYNLARCDVSIFHLYLMCHPVIHLMNEGSGLEGPGVLAVALVMSS